MRREVKKQSLKIATIDKDAASNQKAKDREGKEGTEKYRDYTSTFLTFTIYGSISYRPVLLARNRNFKLNVNTRDTK